jgi:hypothetical protein
MPSSPREERSAGARLRSCSQEMLSIARAAHACKRWIVRQPWVARPSRLLEARTEARTRRTFPASPAHLTRSTMRVSLSQAGEDGGGRIQTPLQIGGFLPPRPAPGPAPRERVSATVLMVAVRLGRSEQRELDALPSRLTEHRSPRR